MSSEMTAKRERVVRWSDPKELEAGARRMSGREFLTASEQPPTAQSLRVFETIGAGIRPGQKT